MKYKKFIDEYDKIKEIIFDFTEDQELDDRFSRLHKKTKKLEDGIVNLKDHLKNKGYSLDEFMKNYKKKISSDFEFTEHNGFMDVLLYNYNYDKPLHGILLGELNWEQDNNGNIITETTMKYSYQYHNYKYGLFYIAQSYNMSEYYYEASLTLPYYLNITGNQEINIEEGDFAVINEGDHSVIKISKNERTERLNYVMEDFSHKFDKLKYLDIDYDDKTNFYLITIGDNKDDLTLDKYVDDYESHFDALRFGL